MVLQLAHRARQLFRTSFSTQALAFHRHLPMPSSVLRSRLNPLAPFRSVLQVEATGAEAANLLVEVFGLGRLLR